MIPKLSYRNQVNYWAKVDIKVGGCWNWTGALSDGYGRFSIDRKAYHPAHRVMLAMHGLQSDTLQACHRCNNRRCVNPEHLRLGTVTENQRDRVAAGTAPRGILNGRAKLSEADVALIREMHGTTTNKRIAELFGISGVTIGRIVHGVNWKDLV